MLAGWCFVIGVVLRFPAGGWLFGVTLRLSAEERWVCIGGARRVGICCFAVVVVVSRVVVVVIAGAGAPR